ncbi:MAG: alpha/beta hydrolase [Actinomadura sp.]
MDPSVRSRAISSVLRLGVRPILHRVPGHPGGIRTARSTVDAASLLMRPGSRVRVLPLHDPQLGTGRDERPVTGEWVVSRDDGSAASAGTAGGAVLYLHGGGYVVCSPRTHRPITSTTRGWPCSPARGRTSRPSSSRSAATRCCVPRPRPWRTP